MVVWTQLRKLSALAVGTGAGLAVYYCQRMREPVAHASWTNQDNALNPCAVWDSNWDFRDPVSLVRPLRNSSPSEENRFNNDLEKVRSKSTRHIVLIRHGEFMDEGKTDETHRLTTRGRLQAKYTGQRLCALNIKWDEVIASTMTRAQETSEIILKEIDFNSKQVKHCSFLREGAPIPPQPPVGYWKAQKAQFFRDGARIEAAFRRYFHRACPEDERDTFTLIVGHANVIRYFVCRALQFPPEAWLRMNINHGSITWLSISPSGNVSIRCLGETGYMPADILTYRVPRPNKL